MTQKRKEDTARPKTEGGLTRKPAICWDGRTVDIAGARSWMVQQLAQEVVRRLREQDNEDQQQS